MRIGYNLSVVLPCQYSQESAKNNDRRSSDDEIQTLVDYIKVNPLWEKELGKINSYSFKNSRNQLIQKFKLTP